MGRVLLGAVLVVFLAGAGVFAYTWHHFSQVIDARLSGEIFERASHVYAAPQLVTVGDSLDPEEIAAQLRRFGYSDPNQEPSLFGRFRPRSNGIDIEPGPASRVGPEEAVRLEFSEGRLTRIRSLRGNRGGARTSARIDPALITNLFDSRRTKRRLVRYEDLPPHLVQALIAAEDRRFFDHPGISVLDGLRALRFDLGIWLGVRKGARPQGASTITMQLSRSFFLNRDLSLKRKAAEAFIALQLERRFNKEKILELYANEIYLGHRGSFTIRGFGEAAQAYFDKDVSQLSLSEAAFLAGIIRGPSRYNPFRNPQRALERRNFVLDAMLTTEAITPAEAEAAKQQPLAPAAGAVEAGDAPYFVDLVRDSLLERYSEEEIISRSYRVNTSLDLALQHAAVEAVREALPEVDAKIAERFRRRKGPVPEVQVALIALDPHTGQVNALVGGRDYARSQLNRAVSYRQPGSGFKPFVFAAAFNTAIDRPEQALTPVTTVVDEPTVFHFDGQEYEPSNYGEKFFGIVTLRDALIHSLNVATVKVAEKTGYDQVANVAAAAGLNPRLQPTPAIALGAYDSTPLEVAGAYTVFANGGNRVAPALIPSVQDDQGKVLEHRVSTPEPVLDPRVAYLVVDLMQDAINRGTGAGARARGFTAPAAGKTGTSRDGWFIGFTSNLLCVVWVGFDDGRDLGLPGSSAALPIWTAFMKRAVAMPAYRNVEEFIPPAGIVAVPLDPETLQVATPDCPEVRVEKFILGTEPHDLCPKHRPSGVGRFTRTLLRAIGVGGEDRKKAEESKQEKEPGVESDAPQENTPPGASRMKPSAQPRPGILRRALSVLTGNRKKKQATEQAAAESKEQKKDKSKPAGE